jgi:hypothetical protein
VKRRQSEHVSDREPSVTAGPLLLTNNGERRNQPFHVSGRHRAERDDLHAVLKARTAS